MQCATGTPTLMITLFKIYLNPKLVTNQYRMQNRKKSVWEVSLVAPILV